MMQNPGTKHPTYAEILPLLMECADAYGGLAVFRKSVPRYLPQETMEPAASYRERTQRARWVSFYRRCINGFVGLLSGFAMNEDAILQADSPEYQNVDGLGGSFKKFLLQADMLALRDGWCGVLVDFPPLQGIVTSRAEERSVSPVISCIERRDIINWRVVGTRLESVVIRRLVEKREGRETQVVEHIWEYFPDVVVVWEGTVAVAEIPLIAPNGGRLPKIPIVFYPHSEIPDWGEIPPLHDLALDNFSHFQQSSDYREVLRKCNLPVPVRRGFWQAGGGNPPPLVLGPNTVIDVPVDGDFFFREPSGVAIDATRTAIVDLEQQMLQQSLAFFGGDGSSQMTSGEVLLRSSQTRSQLGAMASQKESAVQSILNLWAFWLGGDKGGNIVVDRSALKLPMSADTIRVFSDLVLGGLLSRETFLSILNENGALPEAFDLKKELEMVEPRQQEEPEQPEQQETAGESG